MPTQLPGVSSYHIKLNFGFSVILGILSSAIFIWSYYHQPLPTLSAPSAMPRERMLDGHGLYQDGKIIGLENAFSYDQKNHVIIFDAVTFTTTPDFSGRILFRDAALHCPKAYPSRITYGDHPSAKYFGLRCSVVTPEAELD